MMYVGLVDGRLTSELRRAVLRPLWPVGSQMHGDGEAEVLHVAAVSDAGEVLCACVLFPRPYPRRPETAKAWQLRGMATLESARSKGFGGLVVEQAVVELIARAADLLWLEGREAALSFYERHGFVVEGERYLHAESGIPHRMMVRELSGSTTSSVPEEVAGG